MKENDLYNEPSPAMYPSAYLTRPNTKGTMLPSQKKPPISLLVPYLKCSYKGTVSKKSLTEGGVYQNSLGVE